MNYHWLLDNGHGGVLDGEYQTKGKRSPEWSDGSILYEGEFNRGITQRLKTLLVNANIRFSLVVPELEDISLRERVRRVNTLYKNNKSCILVSVHANAGGGRGYEVFTSPGETKSDRVATVFFNETAILFPASKMRKDTTDGDVDKEADFTVLTDTYCPAILTENFFMDNEKECRKYLMSPEGRDGIALAHFNAIKKIEEGGI